MKQSEHTTTNTFNTGLNLDVDPLRKPTTSLSDAFDIKIIGHDGQNFTITNVNGNEESFAITAGFKPLGYTVYNGVVYIISFNSSNLKGEIGSFPSPPLGGGAFVRTYRALQNWTGSVNPTSVTTPTRLDFQTALFNFDLQHQVQAFARIDYDDSVNIYLVDNKNSFRVVNSGFKQDGSYNDRYIWEGSFTSTINVFNESNRPPIVDAMTEGTSGNLKCGNWFFFIRYNTLDYNPTSFLGVSYAVQIGVNGDPYISNHGGPGILNTNKSVTLSLINLDSSYPVFEVGYIRYFDGSYETGLINLFYPIDITGNATITITGNEGIVSLDIGSLINSKVINDIPKTACQTENSAWIGNLKSREFYNEQLLTFARLINITYDDSKDIEDLPFETDDNYPNGQYKDYQNTFENVGYFRGETYVFGIIYVFKDGKESQAFPLTGFDEWNGVGGYQPKPLNKNGIYRFPNLSKSVFKSGSSVNILGVKFDTASAFASSIWTDTNSWFRQNIQGYYFVRGKRRNNLIYQGLAIQSYISAGLTWTKLDYTYDQKACHGTLINCPTVGTEIGPNYGSGGAMPIPIAKNTLNNYEIGLPYLKECHQGGDNPYNYSVWCENNYPVPNTNPANQCSAYPLDKAFGLYSPDFYFINAFENNSYHCIAWANAELTFAGSSTYCINPVDGFKYAPFALLDSVTYDWKTTPTAFTATCTNVPSESDFPLRNGIFTSYYGEGTEDASNCFVWSRKQDTGGDFIEYKNRAFASTRYIGISYPPTLNNNDLVSIYKNDPDPDNYDYSVQYDIKNTEFFKISRYHEINTIVASVTCYGGDCFLQRTYMRQLYNPGVYPPTKLDDTLEQKHYTFGIGLGFVTENNYNTAMRYADSNNTYYPQQGAGHPSQFFSDDIRNESTLVNVGYNITLPPKVYQGLDEKLPFRKTIFPTRIAYSNRHNPNSLTDGYRKFDLTAYKDFDFRLGEITNIVDFKSNILNIQQFGISVHPISEKAMLNDGTAGTLTLGNGERLPQKPISITDLYGSQHQWSIFKTPMGVYGVDANKRKIWRISSEGQAEILSDVKFINSYIISVINSFGSTYSDIIDIIPDTPVYNKGITTSYDQRYGDVIFTFLNQEGESNTIVFNDKLNAFTTKYNFKSPFYISLNDNFYSLEPSNKNDFYVHDVPTIGTIINPISNRAVWYGVPYKPYIEFIVNQYSDYTKIFDNLQLVSDPLSFESIEYQTEQQIASQSPFIPITPPDMYAEPKYRENLWRLAVKRATGIIGNINNPYSIGSILRGKIMKVKLTFKEKEPNLLKSVLTFFKISKQ